MEEILLQYKEVLLRWMQSGIHVVAIADMALMLVILVLIWGIIIYYSTRWTSISLWQQAVACFHAIPKIRREIVGFVEWMQGLVI